MSKSLFSLFLLLILSLPSQAQNRINIAMFSLTPTSIDAIALDGDLLFSIRQEMERDQATFQLMSRREMEEALYRLNGSQVSEVDKVVKYGAGLGVNYVLTGTIDLVRGAIEVNFLLIDVIGGKEVSNWRETFRGKNEMVSKAPQITQDIKTKIELADISTAEIAADSSNNSVIDDIVVDTRNGAVTLRWTVSLDSAEIFFYSVYRSLSKQGPFSFIASVPDNSFVDNTISDSSQYYYRIDSVLADGSEIKGTKIANGSVRTLSVDQSINPPTLLQTTSFVNGVELSFVPAIAGTKSSQGFQLYYRKVGAVEWLKGNYIQNDGKINYVTRVVNTLDGASDYEFAIASVVAGGAESDKSESFKITTAASPVIDINNEPMTRQFDLSWQPLATNVEAKIYRREQGETQWQVIAEVNDVSVGRYSDKSNLKDGALYEYTMSLFDNYSESPRSNIVGQKTKLLPAPTSVTAQGGVKNVEIAWVPVLDDDVKGYRIYRAVGDITPDDLLEELVDINDPQATTFIDGVSNGRALKDGTVYNYLIVALNQHNGVGAVSKTVTTETKPLPKANASILATAGEMEIVVTWEPSVNDDVRHYILQRKWNEEEWTEVSRLDVGETAYTDRDLKPYAATHYRIIVEDMDGLQSFPSESAGVLSPAKIELYAVDNNLLRTGHIAWNEQQNISGFKVYRSVEAKGSYELVKTLNANQTSYIDKNPKQLDDGKRYYYKVTALDGRVETQFSNVVAIETQPVPEPPSAFIALANQVKKVSLQWDPSEDASVKGYKIYRISEGKLNLIETINDRTKTEYIDNGDFFNRIKDGNLYQYKISSFNHYGAEGPLSSLVSAMTKAVPAQVVGLMGTEIDKKVVLTWSPNPEVDIDFYQIYSGSSCSNLRKSGRAGTTRYVDQDSQSGRSYCYRVSAVDLTELEGKMSNSEVISLSPEQENQ